MSSELTKTSYSDFLPLILGYDNLNNKFGAHILNPYNTAVNKVDLDHRD